MTQFNATAFRSQLKGDVARPNLFKVSVTFPNETGDASRKFTFTCRSSQLPSMQIGQVIVPYFGRTIKFAGDRQFEDFAVRVINDEDYTVRENFERWQNDLDIVNHGSDRKERLTDDSDRRKHYATVTVTHYSKGGRALKSYTLHNAFPYVVEGVGLDWQENDTAMEYGVVFAYDYFTVGKANGGTEPIVTTADSSQLQK
jgi:hypothetical protein